MQEKDFFQKIIRDTADSVLKKAVNPGAKEPSEGLDEETKKKLIHRELKMAADPDYALEETAKELATKKMQDKLGSKAKSETEPVEKPPQEKKRWTVQDSKPIEDTEGEYETFAQAYKVAALEAATSKSDPMAMFKFFKDQGLLPMPTKNDEFQGTLMKLLAQKAVESLSGGKAAGDTTELSQLRADLNSLREQLRQASDPVAITTRFNELVTGLKTAGIIPDVSPGTSSIEEMRARYQHEEKMEELKQEGEHKKELRELAGTIPERVGRGLARQIREGGEGGEGGEGMEYFKCKCGATIVVPPEAGDTITCGKCRTVYGRQHELGKESGGGAAGGVGGAVGPGGVDQPAG